MLMRQQWHQPVDQEHGIRAVDDRRCVPVGELCWHQGGALTDDLLHRITDEEAVAMSRYLVNHDGLFLGSSSACNLVACIKLVKKMGWNDGQKIVTIL